MIEFNEDAFAEERNIDQRYWRQYKKLSGKVKSVGSVRCRRDVPGLLDGQLADFIGEAARGNLRRLMTDICQRCKLHESTVYDAINTVQCSDETLTSVENAIISLLWSERFDVPSVPPTMEDLPGWLQRWVGSYNWIGELLGVKPNTIAAWLSRGSETQRQRLLDFAQRWYEARHALWPEKPREQYEAEYEDYLLDREDWAEEALDIAYELERAHLKEQIADWERTGPGQLYREDVERFGEARARALAWEQNRFHPRDLPPLTAHKLSKVERQNLAGEKPEPPSRYEDRNRNNSTRFGAPAPASELWVPAKKVDA